jgi:hypothetical protein
VNAATTRRTVLTPVIDLLPEHYGACNMLVAVQGVTKASVSISFSVIYSNSGAPVASGQNGAPSGPLSCPPPGQIAVDLAGKLYCSSPCTIDQILVPGSCQAVDCVAKYSSTRTFFNNGTGLCEAPAVCLTNEILDPFSNLCVNNGGGGGGGSQPPSSSGGAPSTTPRNDTAGVRPRSPPSYFTQLHLISVLIFCLGCHLWAAWSVGAGCSLHLRPRLGNNRHLKFPFHLVQRTN